MKSLRIYILLSFLLTSFCWAEASQETIKIINNTGDSVGVTFPVPKYMSATISFNKIGNIAKDEYLIIALPEKFLSSDDGHSLNNLGQVTGFIRGDSGQQPPRTVLGRWSSPLKMPSEKSFGCRAAVWSLSGGLKISDLKNSRGVSLNDYGFIAVSRVSDLPHPDVLWDINANEYEEQSPSKWANEKIAKRRIKLNVYDHIHSEFYTNANGSSLSIKYNPFDPDTKPELYLVNSGKYKVVAFESDLHVNKKRLRTALPIMSIRLNDDDGVVAIVNIGGKQAIGSWSPSEGATVSGCLQDNPNFKGYTDFAIAGFNNKGQILLRADVGEPDQLEYNPIKPQMYLLSYKN